MPYEDRPVVYDSSQCLWAGVYDRIITSLDVQSNGKLRPSFDKIAKENTPPLFDTRRRSLHVQNQARNATPLPLPRPLTTRGLHNSPLDPIPASPNTNLIQNIENHDVHVQLLIEELQSTEHRLKQATTVNRKLESIIAQLVEVLREK